MSLPTKYISVTIKKPIQQVYDFAEPPEHWLQWASGLGHAMQAQGDHWIVNSPQGDLKVVFTPKNPYGILDHHVTLPEGTVVYNPVRVFANDKESEVVFTLFKLPFMSDEDYTEDAATVKNDLEKLKQILESE